MLGVYSSASPLQMPEVGFSRNSFINVFNWKCVWHMYIKEDEVKEEKRYFKKNENPQ